jgi:putative hydrolase of the HAD superfamily
MSPLRAVLLDLDDTLTDRRATVRAYAHMLVDELGAHLQSKDVGAIADELVRIDQNGYNRARAADIAASAMWSASPGEAIIAKHWSWGFAVCTKARDDMQRAVDVFTREGLRLGVVTNGPTDKQRRKIESLGLNDRLGTLLISDEIGIAKPDERIFRRAAAELGVAPHECLFVGDNPEKDVHGAIAVGMRAVWFRAALPWPEHLQPAGEAVSSFADLLALLQLR